MDKGVDLQGSDLKRVLTGNFRYGQASISGADCRWKDNLSFTVLMRGGTSVRWGEGHRKGVGSVKRSREWEV